jgi:mannose-6-phosphate isomerase-like protein (cupin superfamily)
MGKPIRRIVTGHDREGRSVFVLDEASPVMVRPGGAGVAVTDLWETTATPADNSQMATAHPFRLLPPANGSVFRIVEYQPDTVRRHADHDAQFREMQAADARDRGAQHFGFHKTNTVDYAIVLSGEIYAIMDDGEALMRAGDVLVQRGTSHAWSNRTTEPVRIAFVLIDAVPVSIDTGATPGGDIDGAA